MGNRKSNFIIKALILGIPAAATLLSPTSKSEAMLKNVASGALKIGKTFSIMPKFSPSNVKTVSNSMKVKSLATSSSSNVGVTTSSNPVKPSGSSVQALIQGLNKGTSSTSGSSSSTSNPTGKLNLNSGFKNKLSELLGSGVPSLDKTKVKTTASPNVGKLSSSSGSSLESIFGNKTSSTNNSSGSGSVNAYVNPNAPAAPSLSSTNTLSPTPSKIPDAPPLPPTKTQNQSSLQPVIKKSSSSTTTPLSNSNRTSIKPQGGPKGYDNMLAELKSKFSKK